MSTGSSSGSSGRVALPPFELAIVSCLLNFIGIFEGCSLYHLSHLFNGVGLQSAMNDCMAIPAYGPQITYRINNVRTPLHRHRFEVVHLNEAFEGCPVALAKAKITNDTMGTVMLDAGFSCSRATLISDCRAATGLPFDKLLLWKHGTRRSGQNEIPGVGEEAIAAVPTTPRPRTNSTAGSPTWADFGTTQAEAGSCSGAALIAS